MIMYKLLNKATYDIQYGNIERVTHSNTSWYAAQFEVCGHKWADLSEDDYGVSLLNDSREKEDGELSKEFSFIKCDKDNVFIEVVKKAEDSDNEVISRIYECHNKRTKVNLTLSNEIEYVEEVDLNERGIGEVKYKDKQFILKFNLMR